MMTEIIGIAFRSIFGLGFVFALLAFMLYRNSFRWRQLAESYQSPWTKPDHLRRFQYGILYGGDVAFNAFKGTLMIGVHKDGIAMKPWGPFGLFHPPIFIPYEGIKGWKQIWYLNDKSLELQFSRVPDMKLVMPREQIEWIQKTSGTSLAVTDEYSPHNDRPNFWYALQISLLISGLGLAIFVIAKYLIK